MNFNQLFYKPKRVSRESIILNRKRYVAFLASLLLISKLSASASDLSTIRKCEYNIIDIEEEFLINDCSLDESLFKKVKISSNRDANTSIAQVSVFSEEKIEEEVIVKDVPLVEGAKFALSVREALKDIPNEVKYNYILEHFRHTDYEFDVIQATIQGEAKSEDKNSGRYIDAFACINSVYNRMCSKTKCKYIRGWTGKQDSITMYDHIICKGQYQPFGDGDYKDYLGVHSGEAYQAVLDFLYIADKNYGYMHSNMDFMASGLGYSDSVKYVNGGNEFRFPLTAKDTIPLEERYYMISIDENLEEGFSDDSEINYDDIDEQNEMTTISSDSVIEDAPIIVIEGTQGNDNYFEEELSEENTLTLHR